MNFYCNSCFKKSDYKFSKPKFCPNCGVSTSNVSRPVVVESNCKPIQKSPTAESCPEINNTNKIQELERRLAAYERINLSQRIAGKNEIEQSDVGEELEDEGFDSHWNGSIDSLRGTMRVEFDKNAKEGVRFSDVAGSAADNGEEFSKVFSQGEQRDISQANYDRILQELKEESSSKARIINID
jgi:hypothetical protein